MGLNHARVSCRQDAFGFPRAASFGFPKTTQTVPSTTGKYAIHAPRKLLVEDLRVDMVAVDLLHSNVPVPRVLQTRSFFPLLPFHRGGCSSRAQLVLSAGGQLMEVCAEAEDGPLAPGQRRPPLRFLLCLLAVFLLPCVLISC